jgi:hypothetical protein
MIDFDHLAQTFGFVFRMAHRSLSIQKKIGTTLSRMGGGNDLVSRVSSLQTKADQLNHRGKPRDKRSFIAKINRSGE